MRSKILFSLCLVSVCAIHCTSIKPDRPGFMQQQSMPPAWQAFWWMSPQTGDLLSIDTLSFPQEVVIWSANTRQRIQTLKGHTDTITFASFDGTGTHVATASRDHTARIWNVQTGSHLVLQGHTGSVWTATFSPDGSQVVTASEDHTAKLWDAKTGALQKEWKHESLVRNASFSPGGTYIVTTSNENTFLWEVKTGKRCAQILIPGATMSVFSPNGAQVGIVTKSGAIHIWSLQQNQVTQTFSLPAGKVPALYSVVYSPDGKFLAAGTTNGMIQLWNVQTGQPYHTFSGYVGTIFGLSFSKDNALFYAIQDEARAAKIWDVQATNVQNVLQLYEPIAMHAFFSANNEKLAVIHRNAEVRVYDIKTEKFLFTLEGTYTTPYQWGSRKNEFMLVDCGSIRFYDERDGRLVRTYPNSCIQNRKTYVSADGTLLIAAKSNKQVVITPIDGDVTASKLFEMPEGSILGTVALASTNNRLAASNVKDQVTYVWDVTTKKLLASAPGILADSSYDAFSSDGEKLLTFVAGKGLQAWQTQDGKNIQTYLVSNKTRSATWTRDGKFVQVATTEGVTELWDVKISNRRVAYREEGTENAWGYLSADSTLLAIASPVGTRILQTATGHLLKTIRSLRAVVVPMFPEPEWNGPRPLPEAKENPVSATPLPPKLPESVLKKDEKKPFYVIKKNRKSSATVYARKSKKAK